MWLKRVHGINNYTDKVPIVYNYRGDTHKNGHVKIRRRCAFCEGMKPPKSFGPLVRNICEPCIERIAEE